MSRQYVRLRDSDGGFYDPETGFKIVRNEVVELPEKLGRRTDIMLAKGGLVYCDPPEASAEEWPVESDAATAEEATLETRDQFLTRRIAELEEKCTVADLDEILTGALIETPKRARKRDLAELVAQYEWDQE